MSYFIYNHLLQLLFCLKTLGEGYPVSPLFHHYNGCSQVKIPKEANGGILSGFAYLSLVLNKEPYVPTGLSNCDTVVCILYDFYMSWILY